MITNSSTGTAYLMIEVALVCFGIGMITRRHPRFGRRALVWFLCGQGLLLLTLATQWKTLWAVGAVDAAIHLMVIAGFAAIVLMGPREFGLTNLFGGRDARPTMRSRYERQIREAAGQEERNRLARDLHDSVKQQIFAIQTQAATAQERFHNDPEGTRLSIEHVRQSASEAMREMEVMLDQLRAAPLENNTLVAAIRAQCEALGFRTGAKVEFTLGDLPASETLIPGTHEAVYRIAQEALANVGKHARASNVNVRLESVGDRFMLTVADDGAGFSTDEPDRGMGRSSMRARAKEIGGTIEVQSAPGRGTTVTAAVAHLRPRRAFPAWLFAVTLLFAVVCAISGKALLAALPAAQAARMGVLWYRERINA